MINIVFLGFGNVNSHLFKAFHKTEGVTVKQVFNRNYIKMISPFEKIPFTDDLSQIVDADVYIIGIPDDAISAFSESLPFQNKLVVHTSGGVSMEALSNKNRCGIFYPLQTFSKHRDVDFENIPICIEAEDPKDLELLQHLESSNMNTRIGAIADFLYSIRCNTFHGQKGFEQDQIKLLAPVTILLEKMIVLIIEKLEKDY